MTTSIKPVIKITMTILQRIMIIIMKKSIQVAPNVDMLKLNCHMKIAVEASKFWLNLAL
jgi:hypothetical protein